MASGLGLDSSTALLEMPTISKGPPAKHLFAQICNADFNVFCDSMSLFLEQKMEIKSLIRTYSIFTISSILVIY